MEIFQHDLAMDPNLTNWTLEVINSDDALEPLLAQNSQQLSLEKVVEEVISGENMEDVTITIMNDVTQTVDQVVEPTYIRIDTVCPEVVLEKKTEYKRGKKSLLNEFEHFHTENGYECPNCGKVYTARKNLARHVRVECGKTPSLSCAYCSYRSYRNNEIQNHIRTKHMICTFSTSD